MTSLALFASFLGTVGLAALVLTIYVYGTLAFVVIGKALREDREAAEQDAELERRCEEGRQFRVTREQRRCLGGRRAA